MDSAAQLGRRGTLASALKLHAWRRDRIFFTGMALAAAAIVFAGFSHSFYLRTVFGAPAIRPLVELHGALFTAWVVLFFVQTTLVAAHRTDVHRRLGVLGGVLAALMLVVGFIVAQHAARRGVTPPGFPPPLVFLALPLGDLAVFATLVGAALWFRRRRDIHGPLMLFATIGLLPPAIARLPHPLAAGPLWFFGLTDLVVLGALVYDRVAHGRMHPATRWGAAVVVLSQPVRLAVSATAAWLAFARWLVM